MGSIKIIEFDFETKNNKVLQPPIATTAPTTHTAPGDDMKTPEKDNRILRSLPNAQQGFYKQKKGSPGTWIRNYDTNNPHVETTTIKTDTDDIKWKEVVEDIRKNKELNKEFNKELKKKPNIKTEVRTRTWESDPDWFNKPIDGYMGTRFAPGLLDAKPHKTENIMEIQEKELADAYAKLLTAKREYFQKKKVLNDLYSTFNIPSFKEEDV